MQRQRSGKVVGPFRDTNGVRVSCSQCNSKEKNLEEDVTNGSCNRAGTFYCADCWTHYEECTDVMLRPTEQFVRACFLGVTDVFLALF